MSFPNIPEEKRLAVLALFVDMSVRLNALQVAAQLSISDFDAQTALYASWNKGLLLFEGGKPPREMMWWRVKEGDGTT